MIEPLAAALRAFPEVKDIEVGSLIEETALYADNMVLFLQDSDEPFSAALSILNFFSNYSGLKVNWSKSQLLPLRAPPPTIWFMDLCPLQ